MRARWSEIDALCRLNSIPFNLTGEKIRVGGCHFDGSLPYSTFDKLQRVSHAAIVENKRLGAQARGPDS
jgi:hypothetical protein